MTHQTAAEDPAEIPKIIEIAPGFCVRQEIDNIAWIDMGEYGIVVDALERPELEGEVFAAIRATLGDKPVRFVLNTHTHYDHVALNEAFVRRFGSEIVNVQTATIPAAGRVFEGSQRRVTMLPMPGCHTEEDCVVWVQPDRALFAGDIFGWGCIPLIVNLRADTAKVLEDTYARMIEMAPAVVIPGHGPLCTGTQLQRWLEYFAWLQREVLQAAGDGKSDEEIIARVAPPEDMKPWWRFLKWKHADAVAKMIKAVRKGWITAEGEMGKQQTPRRRDMEMGRLGAVVRATALRASEDMPAQIPNDGICGGMAPKACSPTHCRKRRGSGTRCWSLTTDH